MSSVIIQSEDQVKRGQTTITRASNYRISFNLINSNLTRLSQCLVMCILLLNILVTSVGANIIMSTAIDNILAPVGDNTCNSNECIQIGKLC